MIKFWALMCHSPRRSRDRAIAIPQQDRIFNARLQVRRDDEFQIDVHQRWTIGTDQQAWLADVLPGEAREQWTERRGEGAALVENTRPGCRICRDYEVEVGEFVHPTGGEGPAGSDADERRVPA
jgi:hypothetical protein